MDEKARARLAAMAITGELRSVFVENNVDLGTAFGMFDTDHDGIVTPAEFRNGLARLDIGLSAEQVAHLMVAMDSDRSGGLDYQEFLDQFTELAVQEEEEGRNLGDSIKLFGTKVSHAELMQEINNHVAKAPPTPPPLPPSFEQMTKHFRTDPNMSAGVKSAQAALRELVPLFPETQGYLRKVETVDKSVPRLDLAVASKPPPRSKSQQYPPARSTPPRSNSSGRVNGPPPPRSGLSTPSASPPATRGAPVGDDILKPTTSLVEQRKKLVELRHTMEAAHFDL